MKVDDVGQSDGTEGTLETGPFQSRDRVFIFLSSIEEIAMESKAWCLLIIIYYICILAMWQCGNVAVYL